MSATKSWQGAVMWAIVPGLVCVAFLLKMASGLFGSALTRMYYLDDEFKTDLTYLFIAASIMALAFYFGRPQQEKKSTQ